MKKRLILPIECGQKTCASEPGKFCEWFGTRKMGMIGCCMLFGVDLDYTDDLWTARCSQCLSLEDIENSEQEEPF